MLGRSVVSLSLQPHGLQPARLLCPWNSPGKDTGGVAVDSSFQPPNDSHPYPQFTDGETETREDLGVSSVRHLAGLGEEPLLLGLASCVKRHFRAELVRLCACVCVCV